MSNGFNITGSQIVVSGSLILSDAYGNATGSLFGTASYAATSSYSEKTSVNLSDTGYFDVTYDTENSQLYFTFPPFVNQGYNSTTQRAVYLSNGNVVITGDFTDYGGTTQNYLSALDSAGNIATNFTNTTGFDLRTLGIAALPDSSIIVGQWDYYTNTSEITLWNGASVSRPVKINSDGTLNTTWQTNIGTGLGFNNRAYPLTVSPDGNSIYMGVGYAGTNTLTFDGNTVNTVIKLDLDGNIDSTFTSNFPSKSNLSSVGVILPSADSNYILVNKAFNTPWSGVNNSNKMGLFNPDGTLASKGIWNTSPLGNGQLASQITFYKTAGASTYHYLFTGYNGPVYSRNTTFNGTSVNDIIVVDENGNLDTSFSSVSISTPLSGTTAGINKVYYIQNEQAFILGGNFQSINGSTHNGIVKIFIDGTIDTTFNSGTGFNGIVNDIVKHPTLDLLLVAGAFTTYDGTTVDGLVRIDFNGDIV